MPPDPFYITFVPETPTNDRDSDRFLQRDARR